MVSSMARGAVALFTLFGLTTAAPSGVVSNDVFMVKRGDVMASLGARTSNSGPCSALEQAGLGSILYYSSDTEYNATLGEYYSQDVSDVTPPCILKPTTAQQVSQAVKALNKQGNTWNVAVKSGGHAPHASAANTPDGVTIDLGRMKTMVYKSCKHGGKYGTVSVGAGSRWGEVYNFLEPQGLMTTGGRDGHVGVGGLLLGGGFSWYEGVRGLGVDNMVAYEVVLADGSIVKASGKSNPDLFKALKGGLNNLGIVTKFDIKTFPAKDVYGGLMAFDYSVASNVLQKFVNMIDNSHQNPQDTGFVSYSWGLPYRFKSVAFIHANTDGVANTSTFAGLENYGPLADMRMTQPLTGLCAQIASSGGDYNIWYTLSVHNTMSMVDKVTEVFAKYADEFSTAIPDEDVSFIIVFSPLNKEVGARSGSNILGLDQMTRNSVILQPQVLMKTTKYRSYLDGKLKQIVEELTTYARSTGQLTPFQYINYANPSQNPLAGYGQENVQFLSKTAKKYDPSGFFQKRVSGPFKVSKLVQ